MKTVQRHLFVCVAITCGAVTLFAQDAKPADSKGTQPKAEQRSQGATRTALNGKVVAIDVAAKTITIEPAEGTSQSDPAASAPKVYKVADETLITKNGKLAKLADVVVGEPVYCVTRQTKDGKSVLTILRFGKMPARNQPKPQ